jgi:predicted lipoprotein with Yx(FWY)xxD motif
MRRAGTTRVLIASAAVTVGAAFAGGTIGAAPTGIVVRTAQVATLGQVLVSSSGRTLYHTSGEPRNVVRCTGACAADWPPLLVTPGAKPVAGPGVRPSLLGTIRRPDGKLQVTYAGMPLYLYAGDKRRGSVEGQGVGGVAWLGGSWNAVTPAGSVAKSAAPPAGTTGGASSSGSDPAPGMTCY